MTVHTFQDSDNEALDWAKTPKITPRLPELLASCRQDHGDKPFLVFDERTATYSELIGQSSILARQLLEAGVGKGTRVGMIFANSPEFVVVWMAIARIGAVAVPMSTFSTAAEIHTMGRHADLAMIISTDRFLNHDYPAKLAVAFPGLDNQVAPYRLGSAPYLREVWIWGENVPTWARSVDLEVNSEIDEEFLSEVEIEVSPADPMIIIYTSGSTGKPKGVVHSHGSILRQGAKVAATYPYQSDDNVLTPMPFFWVGGLTLNLLNVMHVGATLLGTSRTDPGEMLDFVEEQRATYLIAWPHTARALASHESFTGRDLSFMRGGALSEAIGAEHRLEPWVRFGSALGMTETAGPHSRAHLNYAESMQDNFGTAMPGMELRVDDPLTAEPLEDENIGILKVRGNTLMMGMVKREPSEFLEEDGWYSTGDLCSFRDGFLFFHGRSDDLIKAAGSNVAPGEVADVLQLAPNVTQAHVTGIDDPKRGQVVGAVLIHAGNAEVDLAEVRTFAKANLSSYKVPTVMIAVAADEVPMMSSGKLDRQTLLQTLAEAHAASH